MSQEDPNGVPPDPKPSFMLNGEEWKRYRAKVEAEWAPRLSAEEWEQYLDIQWALHDPEVDRLYSDKVVAVHRRQVIASGENSVDVLAEAERLTGLPANRIAVVFIDGPNSSLQGH